MHGKHTVSSAELTSPVQKNEGMQIELDNLNLLSFSKRKYLPSIGKKQLQRKKTPSFIANFYLMRSPYADILFSQSIKPCRPPNIMLKCITNTVPASRRESKAKAKSDCCENRNGGKKRGTFLWLWGLSFFIFLNFISCPAQLCCGQ